MFQFEVVWSFVWGTKPPVATGLMRCLGFYLRFDWLKDLQTPALQLFPQYLHSAHYLHCLPSFGFCIKLSKVSDRNLKPKSSRASGNS